MAWKPFGRRNDDDAQQETSASAAFADSFYATKPLQAIPAPAQHHSQHAGAVPPYVPLSDAEEAYSYTVSRTKVPLTRLNVDPHHPRHDWREPDDLLEGLVDTFQRSPDHVSLICCTPTRTRTDERSGQAAEAARATGQLVVVDGARRLAAALRAEVERLWVLILSQPGPGSGEPLCDWQRADVWLRRHALKSPSGAQQLLSVLRVLLGRAADHNLEDDSIPNQRDLVARYHVSLGTANRAVRLSEEPAVISRAVALRHLPAAAAFMLMREIKDPDRRADCVQYILAKQQQQGREYGAEPFSVQEIVALARERERPVEYHAPLGEAATFEFLAAPTPAPAQDGGPLEVDDSTAGGQEDDGQDGRDSQGERELGTADTVTVSDNTVMDGRLEPSGIDLTAHDGRSPRGAEMDADPPLHILRLLRASPDIPDENRLPFLVLDLIELYRQLFPDEERRPTLPAPVPQALARLASARVEAWARTEVQVVLPAPTTPAAHDPLQNHPGQRPEEGEGRSVSTDHQAPEV